MGGRNLYDVLAAVAEIVPADERERALRLRESLLYKAPEQQRECWAAAQTWLLRAVGVPDTPPLRLTANETWKAEALALWTGKPVEQMEREGLIAREVAP